VRRFEGDIEHVDGLVPMLNATPCDVLLLDLKLPDADGVDILARVRKEHPDLQTIIDATPTHRVGNDEDLKGLTVLLASEASRHINGQVIAVDGGAAII